MSRRMLDASAHDGMIELPVCAAEASEELPTGGLESVRSAALDLLRGLFPLPTHDAPAEVDYAAALEEKYSRPRRCC